MRHRLLRVMVAFRATPDLDIGIPAAETGFGFVLGLVAAVMGVCWRMTTPQSASPLANAVQPFGTLLS